MTTTGSLNHGDSPDMPGLNGSEPADAVLAASAHAGNGHGAGSGAAKTCTLVFLRRDGEILLAMKKRGFGKDRWNGVGGKIEPGETIEQALVRETQEEIGVTPLAWRKVAEHDFVMDDDTDEPWHMHVHAYLCDRWQGEPAESEEMAPRWFRLADIPYDDMWQDDIVWLPLVLRGRQLRCRFTFRHDDSMTGAQLALVEAFQ